MLFTEIQKIMANTKPQFEEVKKQIERTYNQNLKTEAEIAARDFWENWNQLREGLRSGEIKILIDSLFLSRRFPEYGRYQKWRGASISLVVIGIIVAVFRLEIGIPIVIVGILGFPLANYIKQKDGNKFTRELLQKVTREPPTNGMVELCGHYIAGIVALSSENGYSQWPLYPSCVLTGEALRVSSHE